MKRYFLFIYLHRQLSKQASLVLLWNNKDDRFFFSLAAQLFFTKNNSAFVKQYINNLYTKANEKGIEQSIMHLLFNRALVSSIINKGQNELYRALEKENKKYGQAPTKKCNQKPRVGINTAELEFCLN